MARNRKDSLGVEDSTKECHMLSTRSGLSLCCTSPEEGQSIATGSTHAGNALFVPLPSGKWYRHIKSSTKSQGQLLPQCCETDGPPVVKHSDYIHLQKFLHMHPPSLPPPATYFSYTHTHRHPHWQSDRPSTHFIELDLD
ncbi:hypothetical protein AMECASPLE_017320 [Ameca splendens]|uniref:Uncharacterized protein n=1 Tax=Ameca splendens TaxID=208324 RepID=A0ABV0XRG9_9TELE